MLNHMMRKLKPTGVCAALLMLLMCAARIYGLPLAPGITLLPAPAELDPMGGTLIASLGPIAFTSPPLSGPFTGTLTTSVIAGDATNPFGGLTFTFLLTNDATSLAPISGMINSSFIGFAIDASYQVPTTGVPPFSIDRNALGDEVHWDLVVAPGGPGALVPGTSSALLVLQTNATQFTFSNFASVIGSTVAVPSIGPAVPEPAATTGLILLAACVGVANARGVRTQGKHARAQNGSTGNAISGS